MKPVIRFIINPISGSGKGAEMEALVNQSNLADKFTVEISKTIARGHAIELAKEAAEKNYHGVIAVGGDGTVNEVASSLVNTSTALGIIPTGSGNGLAKHLHIPTHPLKAIHYLLTAKMETIDTLKINNRFAVNVSGLGFDGYVAWLFDKEGKRGLSAYTRIGMREYFSYPIAEFEIEADEKFINIQAHMVVIANASQFGNAAIISPNSDLKDGMLDVIIVKRPSILKVPLTFIRLFTGTLKPDSNIQMLQCKKLKVKSARPLHLHIDGEPHEPIDQLSVQLFPASLKVFVN